MRKFLTATLALVFFAPAILSAQVISEMHITSDGKFSANSLTVVQKTGSTLFTRATWGRAFIRVTVLTNASTTVAKKFGETSSIKEIEAGHVLDVEGSLTSGADSVMITAERIRNTALVRESKNLSGVIASVDKEELSFVLVNASFGATKIVVSASTPIVKGARTVEFSDLAVGNTVLSVSGTYDYEGKVLSATSLEIFQDTALFVARNFQGTLKSVSGTILPATLVIASEGRDYTVYLPENAAVLSKDRKAASLKRFAEGDTVRFYGAIRKTNLAEVDAEVIRDLDF